MAGENVLNRFETPGPGNDNPLVLDGTVTGTTGDALKVVRLASYLVDLSEPSSAFVFPGFAGTLVSVTLCVGGPASATGTAEITVEIGGVLVTGAQIGIGTPSAGETATLTPSALNTFDATKNIEVISDGASSGLAPLHIVFVIVPD